MEALLHSFIRAFGWSIVHSFWQGAIIYVILFLILISIPRLSPVAKHNLSYMSVCAIFIWFVATFLQFWQTPVQANVQFFIPVENDLSTTSPSDWSFANIEMLFPMIIALYLGGILVQSFILYKGYRVLQNLRKNNLGNVPSEWKNIFYRVVAKLNINKRIDFHTSQIASVPMVIGYFKPVILFPASLITSLDTEQVEAILIHELTHIRRNDYLLNMVKTFLETILFFNPFVWLTGRFIKIEREHVCDDMVLRYTGQPVKYAETLLQIEMINAGRTPQAAMALAGKKQYLFDRIKRMTNMKTNYMNLKQQLAGISIVIAAFFCLAWLVPSDSIKKKEEIKVTDLKVVTPPQPSSKISVQFEPENDTIIEPKKKAEVKIIVTDPDGNKKEYNSLKALPDSLKEGLSVFGGNNFSFLGDSLMFHGKTLRKQLNGIFNDTAFVRGQKEIAKQFNSPEFKENMKKAFESFNSHEFKKQMEDLKANLNSEEFKKQQEEIRKSLNSAEFKKNQAELMARLHSKEFKQNQRELISRLDMDALKDLPRIILDGRDFSISSDSLFLSGKNKENFRIYLDSRDNLKRDKQLENNKQYQKLKKKFEKDVEKLRKKQANENKK